MTAADFNYMVVSNGDFLKPYARSLTNNIEDANDLFQETMLRALQNREKYRIGTNLKGWLHTIMRNIFINNYRRSKRIVAMPDEDHEDTVVYKTGKIDWNSGTNNIKMKEIKSAMATLHPDYLLSFELYYVGYKYQEIADLLEEPLGTIKSRIHFARKALASQIER